MKAAVIGAVLLCAALGLGGCRSTGKAPECRGSYVPVNSAEHYRQEERT